MLAGWLAAAWWLTQRGLLSLALLFLCETSVLFDHLELLVCQVGHLRVVGHLDRAEIDLSWLKLARLSDMRIHQLEERLVCVDRFLLKEVRIFIVLVAASGYRRVDVLEHGRRCLGRLLLNVSFIKHLKSLVH